MKDSIVWVSRFCSKYLNSHVQRNPLTLSREPINSHSRKKANRPRHLLTVCWLVACYLILLYKAHILLSHQNHASHVKRCANNKGLYTSKYTCSSGVPTLRPTRNNVDLSFTTSRITPPKFQTVFCLDKASCLALFGERSSTGWSDNGYIAVSY